MKKEEKIISQAKSALSEWGRYLLPPAFLLFYLVFESSPFSPVFGLGVFLSLVYIVVADFFPSDRSGKALKSSAWDVAYSVGAALALWLLVSFLLSTSKPIDVVTSCSMLPVLHRGDLVLLQGGETNAPSARTYSGVKPGDLVSGTCTRRYYDGRVEHIKCTTGVEFPGKTVFENRSNDIVVYDPESAFYGLIIHRAFAKVEFQNSTYLLTKGDNNQFLDQQGGIPAVSMDRVHGKTVLIVPAIGYLKIFLFAGFDSIGLALSGNFAQVFKPFEAPPGCDSELGPG